MTYIITMIIMENNCILFRRTASGKYVAELHQPLYGKFQIITLRHFLFIPVHRRRVLLFSVGINPFYTSGNTSTGRDYAFSRFSPLDPLPSVSNWSCRW